MAVELLALQRLANEAIALHTDPAFRRAWNTLYGQALDDFRHSQPEETAKREEAYWRLRTLEDLDREIVAEIQAPITEGKRQDRANR